MKLEIDFDNKTIEVKDGATLGEIVAKLKELRLNWKDFKIVQQCGWSIYPTYPIYPSPTTLPCSPDPLYPTVTPWAEITYGTSIN